MAEAQKEPPKGKERFAIKRREIWRDFTVSTCGE